MLEILIGIIFIIILNKVSLFKILAIIFYLSRFYIDIRTKDMQGFGFDLLIFCILLAPTFIYYILLTIRLKTNK